MRPDRAAIAQQRIFWIFSLAPGRWTTSKGAVGGYCSSIPRWRFDNSFHAVCLSVHSMKRFVCTCVSTRRNHNRPVCSAMTWRRVPKELKESYYGYLQITRIITGQEHTGTHTDKQAHTYTTLNQYQNICPTQQRWPAVEVLPLGIKPRDPRAINRHSPR